MDMYDENNRQLDGGMTPDTQHREEHAEPNFVMSEPTSHTEQQNQEAQRGYQQQAESQGGYQQNQAASQQNYGNYNAGGQSSYRAAGDGAAPHHEEKHHEKPRKKSGGLARKAAGITAAALLFGLVSGGTMAGVNLLADATRKETYPQISQAQTQPETEEAVSDQVQSAPIPAENTPNTSGMVMDVSSIVEEAMPSVVSIYNTMLYETQTFFGNQTYETQGSGSGIIVGQNDEELLIVTNNHVVEDSNTLTVEFIDDASVPAVIKGTDRDQDLAMIAVPLKDIPADTMSQIAVAPLGNSDELKVGEPVVAIGNALGYGQSVTVGWVSALDREVTTDGQTVRNLLQTDAAINPGNSGGALLNMRGEVIGINSAKYADTKVEGMGYAIPISKVQDIIDTMMARKTRTVVEEGKEGYLGIRGLTVSQEMVQQLDMPAGVFVAGIIEGDAASKSDLREKDIITKFDGQGVRSMEALTDMLQSAEKGETVELVVQSLENGQYVERTVTITLGEKAAENTAQNSRNSNQNNGGSSQNPGQNNPSQNNPNFNGGNGFPGWFFGW